MKFTIFDNPHPLKAGHAAGFTNAEFRQLAGLFSRAAANKALYDMAVDVDFDAGVSNVTYYRSAERVPCLQFVIRRVGPRTAHYEVYKEGKGCIGRSGLFTRAYEILHTEISALIDLQNG